ncbi:uncharacterized protein J4E84_005870 [Alternaria hordeiaustralica]|uniref:uncharacterized protein n=1 Tax=Alternaria hordeiaustralica TaxID=1187925 RepID=UPI0020C1BCE6|nr:uncharacterized protein J4E84_005870 [Alternaria hordeiaustralica]KAI4686589.1 hypothetical protein J4E84_005870 [Alternaria hordeiaustralica]
MPYNKYGEKMRHRFDPSEDICYSSIPRPELVFYNPDTKFSQLRMKIMSKPNPIPDDASLVVFIDGACRNNGRPTARASYGVYFGPDSPFNTWGLLDESQPQTSTRAEIEALIQALLSICVIMHFDRTLCRIRIATDSSFLVKALSQWMEGWMERGGVGSNGSQVAHFKIMKQLYDELNSWEDKDEWGVREIQLWHVPREMNREADALANKALDEA